MKWYQVFSVVLGVIVTLSTPVSAKYFITSTFDYDTEG